MKSGNDPQISLRVDFIGENKELSTGIGSYQVLSAIYQEVSYETFIPRSFYRVSAGTAFCGSKKTSRACFTPAAGSNGARARCGTRTGTYACCGPRACSTGSCACYTGARARSGGSSACCACYQGIYSGTG
jgi:hypothetical protein